MTLAVHGAECGQYKAIERQQAAGTVEIPVIPFVDIIKGIFPPRVEPIGDIVSKLLQLHPRSRPGRDQQQE